MPLFVARRLDSAFRRRHTVDSRRVVEPLTLYVYAGRDGSFSLYEDEGTNYNYEKAFAATYS